MTQQQESAADQQASLPVLVIEDDPALRDRIDTLLESGATLLCAAIPRQIFFGFCQGRECWGSCLASEPLKGWICTHGCLSTFLHLIQRVILTGTASKVGPPEWPLVPPSSHLGELLPVIEKTMGKPEADSNGFL